MGAAAGYVGIEADGALWLAAAIGRATEDVAGRAARLTALFEEAGEEDTVGAELRELAAWLQWEPGDVRRRVALAEFGPIGSAVDAGCTVPWSDPLVRAARAVWSNATRALAGAGNSIARTGQLIWQLVPGNDGWQQAWVNLPVGMWQMATNPVATVEALADIETLNEEGFSYWIGGFVPEAAAYLLAGAGAAKTSLKIAENAADVAEGSPRQHHGAKTGDPTATSTAPARAEPEGRTAGRGRRCLQRIRRRGATSSCGTDQKPRRSSSACEQSWV